jgi:hypothetical protein
MGANPVSADDLPESARVGEEIPDRWSTVRSVAEAFATGALIPYPITSSDRASLVEHGTIIARKRARIVGIVAPGPFTVLTDRGPMSGQKGDIIATNHPDDDPGSDVWPISAARYAATYEPAGTREPTASQARVVETNPTILVRVAIEKLRDEAGARDAKDRQRSLAITKLEEALLWLGAEDVL